MKLDSFGPRTRVALPGNAQYWPQSVLLDGKPAVLTAYLGKPSLLVSEGRHVISGRFLWTEMPQSLSSRRVK